MSFGQLDHIFVCMLKDILTSNIIPYCKPDVALPPVFATLISRPETPASADKPKKSLLIIMGNA